MKNKINKLIKDNPEKFDFSDVPGVRNMTQSQIDKERANWPEWAKNFVAKPVD